MDPLWSAEHRLGPSVSSRMCIITKSLLALCCRNALEGFDKPDGTLDMPVVSLHNLVHSVLNGTSAFPHSAANDPIFVVGHFVVVLQILV